MSVFAKKKIKKKKNELYKLVIWLNQSLLGFVPNLIICELLIMFHEERVDLLLANPQLKANNPTTRLNFNFRFT